MRNTILQGNSLDVLKTLPDGSVSCIVTSPPYFQQRKYGCEFDWGGDPNCQHDWAKDTEVKQSGGTKSGYNVGQFSSDKLHYKVCSNACIKCGCWRGELGLEPTIDLYLDHLLAIFDECKRVLRPDGTCWVNIADKMNSHAGDYAKCGGFQGKEVRDNPDKLEKYQPCTTGATNAAYKAAGLKSKSLCAIPERFVIRMLDSGWIYRSRIAWAKGISFCPTYSGSCMPDSARDRPNKNGFEPMYFFTKSGRYWYEQQYEDAHTEPHASGYIGQDDFQEQCPNNHNRDEPDRIWGGPTAGKRILRNVWAINPEPQANNNDGVNHYAAFPTKLVEPCIKAGCPKEICNKCGKPRWPIYDSEKIKRDRKNTNTEICDERGPSPNDFAGQSVKITYSDCSCNAGFSPGIVLDIFGGTGTVGYVATKLKRDYLLIEGRPEYIKDLAEPKLQEATTGIPVAEQRNGQKGLF